jgi:diacylglycerol kinase
MQKDGTTMKNKFLGTGDPGYHPIRKIKVIFSGIRYGVILEISVAYKLVLSGIILVLSFYFHDWIDVMVIVVATGQVLAGEMFNTAIEAVCDFIESGQNGKIGIIKDISAAAAGISIAVWATVIGYEYFKVAHKLLH